MNKKSIGSYDYRNELIMTIHIDFWMLVKVNIKQKKNELTHDTIQNHLSTICTSFFWIISVESIIQNLIHIVLMAFVRCALIMHSSRRIAPNFWRFFFILFFAKLIIKWAQKRASWKLLCLQISAKKSKSYWVNFFTYSSSLIFLVGR